MTEKELRGFREYLEKEGNRFGGELEEYYLRIAEYGELDEKSRDELEDEVAYEAALLEAAADFLGNALRKVSAARDELETRLRDVQRSLRDTRLISPAPANSVIDLREERLDHFAQGMNFYKIFLVCFIGSFAGVVIELLWCFATRGYIESRSGLVYGPFNLLYGFGAVMLMLALYKYRNRSGVLSFIGGFIVGSFTEYVCSWGQEAVFGSRSWDYSGMPMNLNGRICLLYSIFWGILGYLWIKNIYPRMASLILKIPNKWGKTAVWILLVFMVFNAAVTTASVGRWSERIDGEAPSNSLEELLDRRFPDERMERIFANMEFGQRENM